MLKGDDFDSFFQNPRIMFWSPIPQLFEAQLEHNFLIIKHNHMKMKNLKLDGRYLLYGQQKCIDLTNMQIQLVKNPLVVSQGMRLTRNNEFIEIYGNIDNWFNLMKKYCIQHNFQKVYNIVVQTKKVSIIRDKNDFKEYFSRIYEKRTQTEINIKALMKQIQILRSVNSELIERLLQIYESADYIILVIDIPQGQSLADYINGRQLSEVETIPIMLQLFKGVKYLHDKGIFHRDIKPQNIIIQQGGALTLIDLGLADYQHPEGLYLFTRCGTPGYVAPELLQDKKYNVKIDIYSLGIIMYILLTGEHPFGICDYEQLITRNYIGEVDVSELKISLCCQDFLRKVLKVEPQKRMSSKECISHPLLNPDAKSPNFIIRSQPLTGRLLKSKSTSGSPCLSPRQQQAPKPVERQSSMKQSKFRIHKI